MIKKPKYCKVPKKTCDFILGKDNVDHDCNTCDMNKRFVEYTVDNWESYIIDNLTDKHYGSKIGPIIDLLNSLTDEIDLLKQQLFEARKDYLIETADISDKLYLEDEIEEERKEIFGDNDE